MIDQQYYQCAPTPREQQLRADVSRLETSLTAIESLLTWIANNTHYHPSLQRYVITHASVEAIHNPALRRDVLSVLRPEQPKHKEIGNE